MRHISFSQYAKYYTCPRQWQLTYLDGHEEDSNIHFVFGRACHVAIQTFLEQYYGNHEWKTFDMKDVFHIEYMQGIKTELLLENKQLTTQEIAKEFYGDGQQILMEFRKQFKKWFPLGHQLMGCEIPLLFEIRSNIEFKGFLDIVTHDPTTKRYTIWDLKTATRGWRDYQKKDFKKTDQLLFYKLFYSEQYDIPLEQIDTKFLILKRKLSGEYDKRIVSFDPPMTKKAIREARHRLDAFLDIFDMTGEPKTSQFVPTPSTFGCKWCVFHDQKELCPDGLT